MDQYNIHYLLFEAPLYEKWFVTDEDKFVALMRSTGSYHEFNPILKENTTYKIIENPQATITQQFPQPLRSFFGFNGYVLQCLRTSIKYNFYFYVNVVEKDGKEAMFYTKVGQYPSLADFEISAIKDYKHVLSKEKLREFTKAIGLAANGIGIGSFVYLRRIFEHLIEEAHTLATADGGWNEADFIGSRMSEKIGLLSHHLPSFLVENKAIYGILSKGIHELTEDECLAYFAAVKAGIEIILDEKLELALKKKKIEEAKRQIDSIKAKI